LTITCSEWIDASPTSLVDPSLIYISNTNDGTDVQLTGTIITQTQTTTVPTVTLTEAQRCLVIPFSGSKGGDVRLGM
jgi:hypothetical protein